MATQVEETQAKEFLKRAEIRTMRKDLSALRESDSLKERDKIAHIKTLEEQLEEKKKTDLAVIAGMAPNKEKIKRNEVLQQNEKQETIAEKDLKNYANEEERQQIFLLESRRLNFEQQADEIVQKNDPALKLQKNELMLKKRDLQNKLNKILDQEKKLEDEQKIVLAKAQTTTIATEKKSLELRRWDLDKEIQSVEKNRWETERQMQDIDNQKTITDKASEKNVSDQNGFQDKILGIDKQLREIYSIVMAREEGKIKNLQPANLTAQLIIPVPHKKI